MEYPDTNEETDGDPQEMTEDITVMRIEEKPHELPDIIITVQLQNYNTYLNINVHVHANNNVDNHDMNVKWYHND